MLLVFALIPIVIIGSILLFGIVSVVAGIVGGTTAAMLVKNKAAKYLLIIGFCILLLFGALCLLPFIGVFAQIAANLLPVASIILLALIGALAIVGIVLSNSIQNKFGKTILIVLFGIVCVLAVSVIVVLLSLYFAPRA